ncbi:MAG TPA: hypothetical protein VFD58_19995 [Blastocatellia bacterium]|nr:hypothetical protein [Blastocatellia bacterium]
MMIRNWRRAVLPLYLIVCCLTLPLYTWLSERIPPAGPGPKRLVIAFDGVPYSSIAELRAEGRFRHFHDPARQVSTFPSITNPAMVEILHSADSPGYEDHFYDRDRNRLIGGIQERLSGGTFIRGTWREEFNYHAPAFKGALGYVAAPVGAMVLAQLDLTALKKAFRQSTAPEFIGYIGETDSLAHLGGREAQKSFLRTLDRAVEELIAESGGRLEVEMFSDHGNDFTEYQKVDLNTPIRNAGFVIEKSLNHPRGVTLPKYGLIGCGVLFTAPENRASLAEVCASATGVDFAAYREAGSVKAEDRQTVIIVNRHGRARIARQQGRYAYEALGGDPLELGAIVGALRERGALDEAGFADGAEWLRATRDHKYVDPLRRIFDGLSAHVHTLADVIVSCEDGYYIGNQFFDTVARLHATHGNLLRGETEGFAISTRQNLGGVVRGHELFRRFDLGRVLHSDAYFGNGGHCGFGEALAKMRSAGSR